MSLDLIAHTRARMNPTFFARGRAYYQDGLARVVDIDRDNEGMTTILGAVEGSDTYDTEICIRRNPEHRVGIEYQCDCPAYADHDECKHCVALAYAVAEKYTISDDGIVSAQGSSQASLYTGVAKTTFPPGFLESLSPEIHTLIEKQIHQTHLPSRLDLLLVREDMSDAIYKIKLSHAIYRGENMIHLSLYECVRLKSGKYGKGKEILQNSGSRIPKQYSHLRPFLSTGNGYYGASYGTRLSFSDAPETFLSIIREEPHLTDTDEYRNCILDHDRGRLVIRPGTVKKGEVLIPKIITHDGNTHVIAKGLVFFSAQGVHMAIIESYRIVVFHSDLPIAFLSSIIADPLSWGDEEKSLLGSHPDMITELLPAIEDPEILGIHIEKSIHPTLHLTIIIASSLDTVSMRIGIGYSEERIYGIDPSHYIAVPRGLIERDLHQEAVLVEPLHALCHGGGFTDASTYCFPIDDHIDVFFDMIESLEQEGKCTLEYVQDTKRISTLKAKVHVSVTSGIDWFDTEVALELDHEEVNAGEKLLEAIKNNKKYISLDDGSLLMIRDEMRQSLLSLESLGIDPTKTGAQKLGRYMIGTLDTEKDSLLHFSLDREALRLQKSLLNFRSLPKVKIPKTLKATLRAYQETGFSWIHFLEAERFCGILADDMGLGKTIQTITFLLDFLARKSTGAPILIICPTSLIFNWRTEIERFAPSIRVISVTSGKWDKEEIGDAQVVLTTYGIIQRSVDIFTPITWSTLILDEAQNIKNASSVRAKNIRLLTSTFRLALSGTPIENHLMELKSIFDVLMPGFLGSDADFKRRYMSGEREHLTFLSRKIKPFILRRTKEIVAKDLPPKVEEIIYLDMDEDQSKYYDSIKAAYQKKVMKQVETEGFAKSQFIVLEALMRMRQACLSPLLIDSKRKESAVKLTYLEENLSEIIEGGHSVLIFSQFPSFLSHVRGLLERQHHPYFYLDGKTKDRQSLVEGFNRGEKKIFLISLKAGGTGLNLVSADYVIHLDPWWNPAVEAQATDRAHRIGQTRTVFVQKLIVRGTIEEKVLELQNKKKQIVSDIFSGDWSGKLTKGDLAYIFS